MTTMTTGERRIEEHSITIQATPDAIFPLLCPVREAEWIEGWVGTPVHSASGVAEENGVYRVQSPGRPDSIWMVLRRDPSARELDLVFFVPGLQVTRLLVDVAAISASESRLSVRYVRTGLSEEGNRELCSPDAAERFLAMMSAWRATLEHYLLTGEKLSRQLR